MSELEDQEIRSYVKKNFDINIDIITYKTVQDVYSKFLDSIWPAWREFGDEDLTIDTRLEAVITELAENYDLNYKFTLSDLISPTRKRTNSFLTFLIYIKSLIEDLLAEHEDLARDVGSGNEEINALRSAKEKAINECEYIAAELGKSKSNSEQGLKELKTLELKNNRLRDEAKNYKEENKKQVNDIVKLENSIAQLNEELSNLEGQLQLLNSANDIEKNISNFEMKDKTLSAKSEELTKSIESDEKDYESLKKHFGMSGMQIQDIREFSNNQVTSFSLNKTEINSIISKITKFEELLSQQKAQIDNINISLADIVGKNKKSKLKYIVRQEQELSIFNSISSEINKLRSQRRELKEEHQKDIEDIKKQTAAISLEEENFNNSCSTMIEKLENKLETIKKRAKEMKLYEQAALIAYKNHQTKLNKLRG